MKSWLVEISADGEHWQEVGREENSVAVNDTLGTGTFALGRCETCRFLRLVNIGMNYLGNDCLVISGFEIFGNLIE
jgi:hypothetical protein